MKKIVIIPAYNEQGSILNTIEDIRKNAPDFDYVVINDCSKDDTLKLCRKNGIRVLDLPINLGIGGVVQTGYLYAYRNNYDLAVQFDGDGQHDAKFLDIMAETLEKKIWIWLLDPDLSIIRDSSRQQYDVLEYVF